MSSLDEMLSSLDKCQDEMVEALSEMIRVPAIGPENGGDGEIQRSRMVREMMAKCGFDEIEIIESFDDRVKLKARPNIVGRKKGKTDQMIWLVAHMDTVPPGDLKAWTYPPFSPRLVEGKLYGLGTEDNGQAVIGAIYAAKVFIDANPELERGLGVIVVADEEMGSDRGIKFLIQQGIFGNDDIFYVPDYGVPDGSIIEVAEKTILWLQVRVQGKQTHASTPNKGLNASKVGAELIAFLADYMDRKYGKTNALFDPPTSTYEPTKHLLNVSNVNTLPGEDIFFLDFRILPDYDPDEIMKTMRWIADLFEDKTGAKITLETVQFTKSGKPSSVDAIGFKALASAIKMVRGVEPKAGGVGGGTCANYFRLEGWNAYVWQTLDEMAHNPNEYCKVDNLVADAKVFVAALNELCLKND
ncbi:MAG: putative metallohydrolase [Methanomassiliicoccales archaeon PtaU1.Bin124]|nr:MAG: putative metallohydrolase [Methanomassiliicoccales archaeon PtaU1.Bin124]